MLPRSRITAAGVAPRSGVTFHEDVGDKVAVKSLQLLDNGFAVGVVGTPEIEQCRFEVKRDDFKVASHAAEFEGVDIIHLAQVLFHTFSVSKKPFSSISTFALSSIS